jgi:hypothetical protein
MVTLPMVPDEHGWLVEYTLIFYLMGILVCKDGMDFIKEFMIHFLIIKS